ncbi:hypothetical protein CRYUN_Cryun31cG0085000 [Craigia yunnanensis]
MLGCLAVNNPYVMKAWAKSYPESKHVKFFSDNLACIKTLGFELDISNRGFGIRSQRFADLLIDDLKVEVANVESSGSSKFPALKTCSRLSDCLSCLATDLLFVICTAKMC